MKPFYVKSLATALGLLCVAGVAQAAPYDGGQPSLIPDAVAPSSYYGAGVVQHAGASQDDGVPAPPVDNDYAEAMESSWTGSSCRGTSCGSSSGSGSGWFGGVYGMYMTRDDGNRLLLTCAGYDEAVGLLSSRDAKSDWYGGYDVHIGHYFNCGRNGIEFVTSGIFPGDERGSVYGGPGTLKAAIDYRPLEYNGDIANVWTDNATEHSVQRDWNYYNVEINFLSFKSQRCSKWASSWLAGARYVRFDDDLLFYADGARPDLPDYVDRLNHLIETDNNLIGFQLGGATRCYVSNRFSVSAGLKFGIYGNHIRSRQQIGGTAGLATVSNDATSNFGREIDVDTSKNDVAFLGELDLGLNYRLRHNLSATIGYRAIAVTGVALSTEQVPPHIDAIQEMERIDSNGEVILHGAYAGLEWLW